MLRPTSALWAVGLVLVAALTARVVFVSRFPTLPVSDFRGLVDFAIAFRDGTWREAARAWELYSPGMPLLLAAILKGSGTAPDTTSRLATALVTGLLPLMPLFGWRRVLAPHVSVGAGMLLALWPGQIAFSGVVAQDNWVLLPTVALGCLAVRTVLAGRARPLLAAVLYCAAVAIRQEMLVAALPLLVASALDRCEGRKRRVMVAAGVTIALLVGLAGLRAGATGRFALSSEHAGLAVLGAYVPGATADYWADPLPHVAAVEPELLADPIRLQREGFRLALREALARPSFHALRIASSLVKFGIDAESASLYWSIGAPEVLPARFHELARLVAGRLAPLLRLELALVQASFFAALWVAYRARDLSVVPLAAAVLLKLGFHAVTVPQGRYVFAATALEMLCIAIAAGHLSHPPMRRLVAPALGIVLAGSAILLWTAPRLEALVRRLDREPQRVYTFQLSELYGAGSLHCQVREGRVPTLDGVHATLETLEVDPPPGARASATCLFDQASATMVALQVRDPYETGGLPDRMVLVVQVDGQPMMRHDLAAEAGAGWLSVPLPAGEARVEVSLLAVRPDPGAAWGRAARTTIRLIRRQESGL